MKNKAFTHTLSVEKIEAVANSSAEARLKWLEDAQEFVRKCVDPKKLKHWQEMTKDDQR